MDNKTKLKTKTISYTPTIYASHDDLVKLKDADFFSKERNTTYEDRDSSREYARRVLVRFIHNDKPTFTLNEVSVDVINEDLSSNNTTIRKMLEEWEIDFTTVA